MADGETSFFGKIGEGIGKGAIAALKPALFSAITGVGILICAHLDGHHQAEVVSQTDATNATWAAVGPHLFDLMTQMQNQQVEIFYLQNSVSNLTLQVSQLKTK